MPESLSEEEKKYRNRQAALKCRQKKKGATEEMRERNAVLEVENRDQLTQIRGYERYIYALRMQLLDLGITPCQPDDATEAPQQRRAVRRVNRNSMVTRQQRPPPSVTQGKSPSSMGIITQNTMVAHQQPPPPVTQAQPSLSIGIATHNAMGTQQQQGFSPASQANYDNKNIALGFNAPMLQPSAFGHNNNNLAGPRFPWSGPPSTMGAFPSLPTQDDSSFRQSYLPSTQAAPASANTLDNFMGPQIPRPQQQSMGAFPAPQPQGNSSFPQSYTDLTLDAPASATNNQGGPSLPRPTSDSTDASFASADPLEFSPSPPFAPSSDNMELDIDWANIDFGEAPSIDDRADVPMDNSDLTAILMAHDFLNRKEE
ncbi:hypothetical protein G7Y89_g10761 [Cudoniella acicularis]|uniref:BZIP domain-containing protein n=1 Tax=Cudoniella acicularis TaxID=354080 RepID=A0A8H4RC53_9HELO|nr:hypothetical protein G7Y89_g10761 [Cudoniella acicularis]